MILETNIQEIVDAREWDEMIGAQGGHLLQSFAWGALKARFGWSVKRIALQESGSLSAGAQILFRRLAPGLVFAYIPRGPVCELTNLARFQRLLDAVVPVCRAQGAFALKIEPDWLAGDAKAIDVLSSAGFIPSSQFQPRTTIRLDLTSEPAAILAQMKAKWRYNIRLAERKGVTVRTGGPSDLSLFYSLLQVTSERDHFAIHAFEYYQAAFELLRDYGRILIAEHEGSPLAAIFVTAVGQEAIYLYGASGNEHRECMPNHALHWAAIRWAKERGCTRYDLWGIERAEGTRLARDSALPGGLLQFKQGFGGKAVGYVGAFDRVFGRLQYLAYTRALALRRGGLI